MPWFKVDDNLGFHHKVIAAGNPAIGLWVRAGSVCAQQLTDGFVSDLMASTLGTKAQAERLVAVGLWDRTKGGYSFHGWAERQPSKADVEAERAAHAERMRAYRERKRNASRKASPQVSDLGDTSRATHEQRTNTERAPLVQAPRPDPTRPDPTSSKRDNGKPLTKAHRLPDDWRPSEAHAALASQRGVDLADEAEKFRDWAASNGTTKKDWEATFRNWIRNARTNAASFARPAAPRIPHVSELATPPDGLSPDEYAQWEWEQRQKRAAR